MTDRMTAVAKLLSCPFCGSDQVSLSEGETGDGQPWPYVECEDCAATATPENWNRRAALSPAELGGVEPVAWMIDAEFVDAGKVRTFSATKPNPDMWGKATFTPLYASTPRAAEAEWLPIESAPKANGLYVVYTPGMGDGERYGFDYYEDGVWLEHADAYDHYIAVGGAGAAGPDCVCTGPGPNPDYTHWRALTPPSAKGEL